MVTDVPIGVDPERARRWQEKRRRMKAESQTNDDAPEIPHYDAQHAREICDRIAAGETLQAICDSEVDLRRVMRWLFFDEIDDFTAQYVVARSAQLDLMLDEVVAIADELVNPPQLAAPGAGETDDQGAKLAPATAVDKDRLAIAKLRIEVRRWRIERQLKATSGPGTSQIGRLIPSEILRDGVSS